MHNTMLSVSVHAVTGFRWCPCPALGWAGILPYKPGDPGSQAFEDVLATDKPGGRPAKHGLNLSFVSYLRICVVLRKFSQFYCW